MHFSHSEGSNSSAVIFFCSFLYIALIVLSSCQPDQMRTKRKMIRYEGSALPQQVEKNDLAIELTPLKLDFNIFRNSTFDIPTWKGICSIILHAVQVASYENIRSTPTKHKGYGLSLHALTNDGMVYSGHGRQLFPAVSVSLRGQGSVCYLVYVALVLDLELLGLGSSCGCTGSGYAKQMSLGYGITNQWKPKLRHMFDALSQVSVRYSHKSQTILLNGLLAWRIIFPIIGMGHMPGSEDILRSCSVPATRERAVDLRHYWCSLMVVRQPYFNMVVRPNDYIDTTLIILIWHKKSWYSSGQNNFIYLLRTHIVH